MDVDLEPLRDVLKAAVNAFYCSIFRHGPYGRSSEWTLSKPVEVNCIWPQGEPWISEGTCIYICDNAALLRLRTALSEVVIYNRGLVWPHVNLASEPPTVEWLMFSTDKTEISAHATVPFAKEWFVISRNDQHSLDNVASLHDFVPTKLTVTVSHQSAGTEVLHVTRAKTSLTSIILHPGDVIISFPHSTSIHTLCVADKYSVKNCANSDVINNPAFISADLPYHTSFQQIPQFLRSIITNVREVQRNQACTGLISLHDEIIVKEEPLIAEGSFFKDATSESNNLKGTSKSACHGQDGSCTRFRSKENYARLLQCPRCPKTFKFGPSGQGFGLLMSHVCDCHEGFKDHCISVIEERYSSFLEDAHGCDSNGEK